MRLGQLPSLFAFWLCMSIFSACSNESPTSMASTPIEKSTQNGTPNIRVSPPTAAFLQPFFRSLLATPQHDSVVVSPAAVSSTIALLAAGATSTTQFELQRVLDKFHRQPLAQKDNVSRALFVPSDIFPNKQFTRWLRQTEGAEVITLDDLQPITTVSRWLTAQARGEVNLLVPLETSNQDLVIASAMHFNGSFLEAFQPPVRANFYQTNGTSINTSFISYIGQLNYLEHGAFEAVQLPFSEQDTWLTLVLPTASDLPQHLWPDFTRVAGRDVQVTLPEFVTQSTLPLRNTLQASGVHAAFTKDQASFKAMTAQPLAVTDVIQQTRVEITRTSSNARRATKPNAKPNAIGKLPSVSLRFDRPFYYAIHREGTLLILGYYNG